MNCDEKLSRMHCPSARRTSTLCRPSRRSLHSCCTRRWWVAVRALLGQS